MILFSIVLVILGIIAAISGNSLNNDLEAVAKNLWNGGSGKPGTAWIAIGVLAIIAGVGLFAYALYADEKKAHQEALREINKNRQSNNLENSSSAPAQKPIESKINPVCPECGTANADGAQFCNNCGAKLKEKEKVFAPGECRECGAMNEINAKFCNACGTALPEIAPAFVLSKPAVKVEVLDGKVVCPCCDGVQLPTRKSCFRCGTEFDYGE